MNELLIYDKIKLSGYFESINKVKNNFYERMVMKNLTKNFCAMVTSLVFIFSFFLLPLKETGIQVLAADTSSNSATQQPFTVLPSAALTSDMGAGWDLGNTMDGHTGFNP